VRHQSSYKTIDHTGLQIINF